MQVIGAPTHVAMIWSLIKRWVDPGTVAKLELVPSDEVLSRLSTFINLENIPQRYGGGLNFEPGMPPTLDDRIRRTLLWRSHREEKLPLGPLRWVDGPECSRVLAVGSVNEEARNEEIATKLVKPAQKINLTGQSVDNDLSGSNC